MMVSKSGIFFLSVRNRFFPQGKPEELNEILASIESSGGEPWLENMEKHEVPVR